MKMNSIDWESARRRASLYAWPTAISTPLMIVAIPWAVETSPLWSLAMPWLLVLVFVPFIIVDVRRSEAEAAREKRELQEKYEAEDEAMFGKSLRIP